MLRSGRKAEALSERRDVHVLDVDQLVARGGSARDRDSSGRDSEALGDQLADRVVGLALHGRSGHAYEHDALALTGDLVPPGARLNPHGDAAQVVTSWLDGSKPRRAGRAGEAP